LQVRLELFGAGEGRANVVLGQLHGLMDWLTDLEQPRITSIGR
jgi:hypothetical protein